MSGVSAFVRALNQKIRSNKVLDYFCSTLYAFTFMRYSLAVTPKNYLLFACHCLNAGAQLTQGYRWTQYHYADGKEKGEAKLLTGAAKG
ncbi:hypothetical protein PG999_012255 [Apiospora kogelbergensis]|uniref:Mitochondrial pyruvate carrier n=1 Tax=Apiospora kogelbergensis TaxID=1337665 RepID=A0AAW0QHP9_9PEZI